MWILSGLEWNMLSHWSFLVYIPSCTAILVCRNPRSYTQMQVCRYNLETTRKLNLFALNERDSDLELCKLDIFTQITCAHTHTSTWNILYINVCTPTYKYAEVHCVSDYFRMYECVILHDLTMLALIFNTYAFYVYMCVCAVHLLLDTWCQMRSLTLCQFN